MICSDDSSSEEDKQEMQGRFPKMEFLWHDNVGHAESVKRLFAVVDTEFLLHWEDDWLTVYQMNLITYCLDILADGFDTIALTPWRHGRKNQVDVSRCKTTSGHEYDYITSEYDYQRGSWPGFTLNPALHRTASVHATGEYGVCKFHEFNFSKRYLEAGFKTVNAPRYMVNHIGEESAYDLNIPDR